MSTLGRTFVVLVGKEWRLECRSRDLVTLLLCTGIMMAALIGAGVSSSILEDRVVQRLFPMLLWLAFLFSTVASLTRSHENELEGHGFEGLLLSGVDGSVMYAAKVVVLTILLSLSFVATAGALGVALNRELFDIFPHLLVIGALTSVGIASLTVLLSAVASTSRMKGVLLPILTFPLLFPYFFAGLELTSTLFEVRRLDLSSIWISLLVGADVVFFLLGLNLYELVLRD